MDCCYDCFGNYIIDIILSILALEVMYPPPISTSAKGDDRGLWVTPLVGKSKTWYPLVGSKPTEQETQSGITAVGYPLVNVYI